MPAPWRHWIELRRLGRKFVRLPPREALADETLCDELEEAACAVFFNVQGYRHELRKVRSK